MKQQLAILSIFGIMFLMVGCTSGNNTQGENSTTFGSNRGINYDPSHSQAYLSGQQLNNVIGLNQMRTAIDKDLVQIQSSGFQVVKTYYSAYCNGVWCISIVNEASQVAPRLHFALGVYEFYPSDPGSSCSNYAQCRIWTESQIEYAVNETRDHANMIKAIMVGNEDLNADSGDASGHRVGDIIINDIATIRNEVGSVSLGSPQIQTDWLSNSSLAQRLANASDFIAANIYPFWGGESNPIAGVNSISQSVESISKLYNKPVVVSEEGWSSYNAQSTSTLYPSQTNQQNYFLGWVSRSNSDNFDSYYFSMYDSGPHGDGNRFGLCTSSTNPPDRSTKDVNMFICPPAN